MILRPHEEEKCVVLDAVVRSFPPPNPLCLRWSFPVWVPAPDLDTQRLAKGRRKKNERPAEVSRTVAVTPEDFVERFITADTKTVDVIVLEAVTVGIPERKARMLLSAAESKGLAYPWEDTSDRRRKPSYASRPQPTLMGGTGSEPRNINVHTHPVPPESA